MDLEVLVRNAGRLIAPEQLLAEVWGPQYREESNYLRVHVAHLRRKLEPSPAPVREPRLISPFALPVTRHGFPAAGAPAAVELASEPISDEELAPSPPSTQPTSAAAMRTPARATAAARSCGSSGRSSPSTRITLRQRDVVSSKVTVARPGG